MREITIISDTHNRYKEITPMFKSRQACSNDFMIIHAGDATGMGSRTETRKFLRWFASLPYDHKIFVPGNHDIAWEKYGKEPFDIPPSVHVLIDEEVVIDGIRIYGSPWQPRFGTNWAFNLERGEQLKRKWDKIPPGTDILITHGPPHGIMDIDESNAHMGCEALRNMVRKICPKLHVFGHNHRFHDVELGINKYTVFVNASMLDYTRTHWKKCIKLDWDDLEYPDMGVSMPQKTNDVKYCRECGTGMNASDKQCPICQASVETPDDGGGFCLILIILFLMRSGGCFDAKESEHETIGKDKITNGAVCVQYDSLPSAGSAQSLPGTDKGGGSVGGKGG